MAGNVMSRLRAAGAWWRARDVLVRDAVLALAFTALVLVPGVARDGLRFGELPHRHSGALALVLIVGQGLPLALRRRQPAWCLAVVGACFCGYQLGGYGTSAAGIGLLLALYAAGAYAPRSRRALAIAATAVYAALSLTLAGLGSAERVVDFLTFYLILAACWGAGAWMRAWRAGEAQRSRLAADQAITEERARIARELHDVVTHHVTAMVVQADAAGYLVSSPERLTEGLTAISATGRRALAELRYLLGVLDAPPSASPPDAALPGAAPPGAAPPDAALRAPALGDLADLAAQTRRGGQPVELTQDGEPPPMAAATQLAAYRVVQEALTNAVKHAPGQRTVVRIRYGDAIDIEAVTDGPPGPPGPPRPPGRGLTGLGERVRSCGGELRAGARPEGGFSVAARIPLETAP